MAEYIQSNALESVSVNTPITYDSSIPCNRGCVFHEDGTGVFILRGIVNCSTSCFARYELTFNGNIALPTGGTVAPIALAVSESGETIPASLAIYTPAAVDEYGNVTVTATITVPRGCCFAVAVRNVPANTTDTPAPSINVQNATLRVKRVA